MMLMLTAVVLLFGISSPANLTVDQRKDRYFGSLQYSASLPSDRCAPQDCRVDEEIRTAAKAAGVEDLRMNWESQGIPVQGQDEPVTLNEAQWSDSYHPEEVRLRHGHWPQAPGEAVVAENNDWNLHPGDTVNLYGLDTVSVVGVVQTVHASQPNVLFTAPGTTDQLFSDLKKGGNRYAAPDVLLTMRWTGGDTDAYRKAMVDVGATSQNLPRDAMAASVQRSWFSRADIVEDPWWWFASAPWNWGILPFGVAGSTAGLLALLATFPFIRRVDRQLQLIGMPVASRVGSALGLRTIVLAAALAGSGLLGGTISLLLRPLLHELAGHELRPLEFPWFFALSLALLCWLPSLVAALVGACRPSMMAWGRTRGRALLATAKPLVLLLGTFVLIYGTGVQLRAAQLDFDQMNRMVLCLVLVAALAFAAVLLLSVRGRLVRNVSFSLATRKVAGMRGVAAVVVVLTMLCLSIPLGQAISSSTSSFISAQKVLSDVPEGDVALGLGDVAARDGGVPALVADQMTEYLGTSRPAVVRSVGVGADDIPGIPFALSSQEELEAVIGRPLTAEQKRVWSSGGVLLKGPKPTAASAEFYDLSDTGTPKRTAVPLTALGEVPAEYAQQTAGFMSMSAAQGHQWPMQPPYYVWTDLSATREELAAKAPEALHFDPAWLSVHKKPTDFSPPTEVALLALALMVIYVVCVGAMARMLLRQMQGYVRSLSAVGLGPGVLGRAMAWVLVILVLVPSIVGLFVGILANRIGWSLVGEGYDIVVPWSWILGFSGISMACALVVVLPQFISLFRGEDGRRRRTA